MPGQRPGGPAPPSVPPGLGPWSTSVWQTNDATIPDGGKQTHLTANGAGVLGGGVAGRLDGMLGAPGVHAALERLDVLEAEPAELQRRPGAGLFPRSGAVQDIGLVAEAVGRPLGDLVG
jgi:hypothetical protein